MTVSQQRRLAKAKLIGLSKAKKLASQCASINEFDVKLSQEVANLKIAKVSKEVESK